MLLEPIMQLLLRVEDRQLLCVQRRTHAAAIAQVPVRGGATAPRADRSQQRHAVRVVVVRLSTAVLRRASSDSGPAAVASGRVVRRRGFARIDIVGRRRRPDLSRDRTEHTCTAQ